MVRRRIVTTIAMDIIVHGALEQDVRVIKSYHNDGSIRVKPRISGSITVRWIAPSPSIIGWFLSQPIQNTWIPTRRQRECHNETHSAIKPNKNQNRWFPSAPDSRMERPNRHGKNDPVRDKDQHGPVGSDDNIQTGPRVSSRVDLPGFFVHDDFVHPLERLFQHGHVPDPSRTQPRAHVGRTRQTSRFIRW